MTHMRHVHALLLEWVPFLTRVFFDHEAEASGYYQQEVASLHQIEYLGQACRQVIVVRT